MCERKGHSDEKMLCQTLMCLLAFFLLNGVGTATSGAGGGCGSKNAGRTKVLPVAGPWLWQG